MVVDCNLNSSMSMKVLKLLAMWQEKWIIEKVKTNLQVKKGISSNDKVSIGEETG
jgi:hypothetical protein